MIKYRFQQNIVFFLENIYGVRIKFEVVVVSNYIMVSYTKYINIQDIHNII